MEKILIITDATTEDVFAVVTEEGGSLRAFGVDAAGQDWADWVDQQTKGRGTLESIIPTLGYAMRVEGPKPLTRQMRANLSDLLPKLRDDVKLELTQGRVKISAEKSAQYAPVQKTRTSVGVKSVAGRLISSLGEDNRQNLVNYKARAFFIDRYHASMAYEIKAGRAMWDPDLGPSGGWRCPPGTRFGGYITDEWGRNCGWGVTRRIVNAISSVGQSAENFTERRQGRRGSRKPAKLGETLREQAESDVEIPTTPQARPEDMGPEQILRVEDFPDLELVNLEAGSRAARRERRYRRNANQRQVRRDRGNRRFDDFLSDLSDVLEYGRIRSATERETALDELRQQRGELTERRMRRLADRLDLGWGRGRWGDREPDGVRDRTRTGREEAAQPVERPSAEAPEREPLPDYEEPWRVPVVPTESVAAEVVVRDEWERDLPEGTVSWTDLRDKYSNDPDSLRRIDQAEKATRRRVEVEREEWQADLDALTDGTVAKKIKSGRLPPAVEGDPADPDVIGETIEVLARSLRSDAARSASRLDESLRRNRRRVVSPAAGISDEELFDANRAFDLADLQNRVAVLDAWLDRRGVTDFDAVPDDVTLGGLRSPATRDIAEQQLEAEHLRLSGRIDVAVASGDLNRVDDFIRGLEDRIELIAGYVGDSSNPYESRVRQRVRQRRWEEALSRLSKDRERLRRDSSTTPGLFELPAGDQPLALPAGDQPAPSEASNDERVRLQRLRTSLQEMFDRDLEEIATWPTEHVERHIQDMQTALTEMTDDTPWSREYVKAYTEFVGRMQQLLTDRENGDRVIALPAAPEMLREDPVDTAIASGNIRKMRDAFKDLPERFEAGLAAIGNPRDAADFRSEIEFGEEVLNNFIESYIAGNVDDPRQEILRLLEESLREEQIAQDLSVLDTGEDYKLMADYYGHLVRRYQGLRDAIVGPPRERVIPESEPVVRQSLGVDDERSVVDEVAKIQDYVSGLEQTFSDRFDLVYQRMNDDGDDYLATRRMALGTHAEHVYKLEKNARRLRDYLSRWATLSLRDKQNLDRELRKFGINSESFSSLSPEVQQAVIFDIAKEFDAAVDRAANPLADVLDGGGDFDLNADEIRGARRKFVKRYADQSRRRRNLLRNALRSFYGDRQPWNMYTPLEYLFESPDEVSSFMTEAFTVAPFEGRGGIWFKTEADRPDVSDTYAEISGTIYAADSEDGPWEVVGSFERILHQSGYLSSRSMFLRGNYADFPAERVKNAGFQGVFNPHAWLFMRAIGVGEVHVSTTDDGPYVWGRVGYRDEEARERVLEALNVAVMNHLNGVDGEDTDDIVTDDEQAVYIKYLLQLADAAEPDEFGLPELIVALSDYDGLTGDERKQRERFIYRWFKSVARLSSGILILDDQYFDDMYNPE